MDSTFLQERITKIKERIVLYEDAIDALVGSNAVQSYTIDTGQTRQTVTRADVGMLEEKLSSLMNKLATYEARLNGSGVTTVRPSW